MGRTRKAEVTIKLTGKEKKKLKAFVRKGSAKAREISRARVLLLSDSGSSPSFVSESLGSTKKTIQNIKERYLEGGLERALHDAPRPGKPPIFDGKTKAKITALACSDPDEGNSQWSLRLLSEKAVELEYVDSISHTKIATILKKTK